MRIRIDTDCWIRYSRFVTIISMLVSLGILLGSNGVAVEAWSVQPSAILAVCAAISNQAIRFSAFQGLMVAWWHRGGVLQQTVIDLLLTFR